MPGTKQGCLPQLKARSHENCQRWEGARSPKIGQQCEWHSRMASAEPGGCQYRGDMHYLFLIQGTPLNRNPNLALTQWLVVCVPWLKNTYDTQHCSSLWSHIPPAVVFTATIWRTASRTCDGQHASLTSSQRCSDGMPAENRVRHYIDIQKTRRQNIRFR